MQHNVMHYSGGYFKDIYYHIEAIALFETSKIKLPTSIYMQYISVHKKNPQHK